MTTLRYCVGGRWAGDGEAFPCVVRFQHKADCEDREKCGGCLPRQATDGYLCGTCHRYLAQWLAAPMNGEPAENSLLFAWGWLAENVARTSGSAAREDWQRSGGGDDDGRPLLIRDAVYDCRTLLRDRVYVAEERLCQAQGVVMADLGAFDFGEGLARLRNNLIKIEDDRMLVGEMFRKFQDSMVTAHHVAPWRATATKVRGADGPIPCPHCQRKTLSHFGGDEHVTCTSCHVTILRGRFDQWTAMLESERGLSNG